RIFLNGEETVIRNPLAAGSLGIGMVHQHFHLIPQFTVAENVVLGLEPRKRGFLLDREEAVSRVRAVMDEYGFNLDPEQKAGQLTVGQMQLVEIIKILYRRAELLILDEPTSVLTEQQINRLFDTMRNLVDLGKTIIIITHKLREVKSISRRVTVMRKGQVVALRRTAEVDEKELSRLMVGRSILFQFRREEVSRGKEVLELKDIVLADKGRDHPLLDHVNLAVHSGEIVGVAGVGGNGLSELEDVVSGLRPLTSGYIMHQNMDISRMSTSALRERGLAYVPADRLHRGASLESIVLENMIISDRHSFIRVGVFKQSQAKKFCVDLKEDYSIDGDLGVPIGTLSGGNIQKVILARELASKSDFIIFSEPTWGLDVASSDFIYTKILELRKQGVAILLISSNLDEILGLCDTLVVMYRGRIVAKLPNSREISKELIGEYMLGLRDDFREGTK
ncbi:MAG: ATP-binding cassette domain-containing protein, partial [Spirochaetales bacterium]